MSQSFIGEIKMFGGNFAPAGYARCDGQLMSIAQNDALFALIGTTYGGDGQNTFGMPDLRGRIPVHSVFASLGPVGSFGGNEQVTLSSTHMPVHSHNLSAGAGGTKSSSPAGAFFASGGAQQYASNRVSPVSGNLQVGLSQTGSGVPHNNMMPYAVLTFIIALQGIFPSPN